MARVAQTQAITRNPLEGGEIEVQNKGGEAGSYRETLKIELEGRSSAMSGSAANERQESC